MSIAENGAWAAEIAADIKERLGIAVEEAQPIDKGWLNVKWKMGTRNEPIFVKFYHPKRYKLHQYPERKAAIRKTLELQHGLHAAGVRCPDVWRHEGQVLHETATGLHYAVLDWVDGYTAPAGGLDVVQMYQLGREIGKMHGWLRYVQPLDKPAWQPDKGKYLEEWRTNWNNAREAGDEIVQNWLGRSREFVESLDFQMFDGCTPGWLHWDLWVDNIVFNEKGLTGIVDFDRMSMAYQEIDVALALLSGALRDGGLQADSTRAFLQGYREHADFPQGGLARAMGMLYLIESIWWFRTKVREESALRGLLARFIEEMHWIEDHWDELRCNNW